MTTRCLMGVAVRCSFSSALTATLGTEREKARVMATILANRGVSLTGNNIGAFSFGTLNFDPVDTLDRECLEVVTRLLKVFEFAQFESGDAMRRFHTLLTLAVYAGFG